MTCKHCGNQIHAEIYGKEIVWVDNTGGDVCPVASLDPNENRPHEPEEEKRGTRCWHDAMVDLAFVDTDMDTPHNVRMVAARAQQLKENAQ